MEQTAHTPGPWKIVYNTDYISPDEVTEEDITFRYVTSIEGNGGDGPSVYYTEGGYFQPNPADVALIAAAPAMLAALEAAEAWFERGRWAGEEIDAVRAAIAQARGGEKVQGG